MLASCGPAYHHHVSQLVSLANKEYQDFLQSEDGFGFSTYGKLLKKGLFFLHLLLLFKTIAFYFAAEA